MDKKFTPIVYIFAGIGIFATVLFFLFVGVLGFAYATDLYGIKTLLFGPSYQQEEGADAMNRDTAAHTASGLSPDITTKNVIHSSNTQNDTQETGPEAGIEQVNAPSLLESFGVSESQVQLLELAGIDTASLPSEFTPELEQCLRKALGSSTVDQIMNGSYSPGLTDILKAKQCL